MPYTSEFCKFYNNLKIDVDTEVDAVYHYTSANALLSIIEKKELRFTDRFYLNDKSEGIYVLELCKENLSELMDDTSLRSEIKKVIDERIVSPQSGNFYVYQCSCSTDRDNLALWNYYTKNKDMQGYNIKMRTDIIRKILIPTSERKLPVHTGNVVYDKAQQLSTLKQILNRFCEFQTQNDPNNRHIKDLARFAVDKIMMQGIFFKNPYFEMEKEYRIAIVPYIEETGEVYAELERKFMERYGIFIPYFDVAIPDELINGITVSPTMNFETAQKSLQNVLSLSTHLRQEDIIASKIPVRY